MSNPYIDAILKDESARPERDFPAAVSRRKDDPKELHRIAEAYCGIGGFREAIAIYDRIIDIDRAWIDVLDHCARAHWAIHDYKKAIALWDRYLRKRLGIYRRLGIPRTFHTIDDVFTSAFGNYAHLYPIRRFGYLSSKDVFYYHSTPQSEGRRSVLPSHNKIVSNSAMRDCVFGPAIRTGIPEDILGRLARDDYVTRLPFYCAMDMRRRPTHFHNAFADRMLACLRAGMPASLSFDEALIARCKKSMAQMGINAERPIVCLHARESGYWSRTGDRTHSTKNADILSYLPAIRHLIDQGYQIVRLGDPSMKPLPPMEHVADYALRPEKSDELDLYLLRAAKFLICTCSGPYAVATMFGTPVLATNWIPAHIIPFSPRDVVLLKKIRRLDTGQVLSLKEMLALDFAEFSYYNLQRRGLAPVDNTGDEILVATRRMLEKLDEKPAYSLAERIFGVRPGPHTARFYGYRVISEAEIAGDLGEAPGLTQPRTLFRQAS